MDKSDNSTTQFNKPCESSEVYDLHSAALVGDVNTIASTYYGENCNKMNREGWTPLMYALSSQNEQVVKFLIENGANPQQSGKNGLTPIMIACRNASCHLIDFMLRYTSSKIECIEIVDHDGWTPLFHAVYMGQEETVKYLIQNGANIHVVDKRGCSVLDIARSMKHEMGFKVLKIIEDVLASPFTSSGYETKTIFSVSDGSGDLLLILKSLNIEKYWNIFHCRGICLMKFLKLTEKDLIEFGIRLLGPRRKLMAAITALKDLHEEKENSH